MGYIHAQSICWNVGLDISYYMPKYMDHMNSGLIFTDLVRNLSHF